jgi:hypothetical protein
MFTKICLKCRFVNLQQIVSDFKVYCKKLAKIYWLIKNVGDIGREVGYFSRGTKRFIVLVTRRIMDKKVRLMHKIPFYCTFGTFEVRVVTQVNQFSTLYDFICIP